MQTCILHTVGNERQISLVYMRYIYIYMYTYMSIYIYIHIAGEKRRGPTIQSHSKKFITIVPKTDNDHPKCIRIHPTSIQNPSNIHPISFLNHPKPSKNHPNSSKIYPKPSRKIGCKRKSQIPPLSGKGVGGTRALAHSIYIYIYAYICM